MPDNSDLISEVLEKMIDSQISNTQALTALKSTLDENNDRLKSIDGFFRNGFRQDLRTLVSELEDIQEGQNNLGSKIGSVEDSLRDVKEQNKLWVKVVATIAGLGAIAALIAKFIS